MIRFYLALILGKIVKLILKIMKRKIPYYPGYIALKVCPKFLDYAPKPNLIIGITGTNGKSTIAAMLTDIFTKKGYNVLNNNGFNISTGFASAFLDKISILGKLKANIAVIEIDEKTSGSTFKSIIPNYLICTNIFRDSMKGNGNPDYILSKIKSGLPKDTKLVLNADDVLACSIGDNRNNIYYGIEKLNTDKKQQESIVCDIVYCPKCSDKLKFNSVRYHHIGNVTCLKCGFKNPERDYNANIISDNLEVTHKGKIEKYPLVSSSIFNIYNELAVISILRELNYSKEEVKKDLENIKITDSRYIEEVVDGIKVINHMSKGQNPVACSRVFDYVRNEEGNKVVLLLLDDIMDKRDSVETVAWYYDTDFEFLNDDKIKQIIVGGVRCKDVFVRLLLAGIDKRKIILSPDEFRLYKEVKTKGIDSIFLLYDITAFDQSMVIRKSLIEHIKGESK